MEYLLLIHKNTKTSPSDQEWHDFFALAAASGTFHGGSALGGTTVIGDPSIPISTRSLDGFMRFESDHQAELVRLLQEHPVVRHGGSLELVELPRTD